MNILETERLQLSQLSLADAGFILELVNEPDFIRFIGDKGVRTLEDAQNYLRNGPLDSYTRRGFGLWLVRLKSGGEPVGMCGLIRRDCLPDVDLGYAFLARFWGQGYAREAAAAVRDYGLARLGLKRLLALTDPQNTRSMRVLEKLGFKLTGQVRLSENGPESNLFALDAEGLHG